MRPARRAAVRTTVCTAERPVIIAAIVSEPDPLIGTVVAALVDVYEHSDCLEVLGSAP